MSTICTPECWTEHQCTVCGQPIAPTGRSIPVEAASGYCQRECPGNPGGGSPRHLWDEHDGNRSYLDPDGWADHVASCEQCGGEQA